QFEGHLTDVLTNSTIEFIESKAGAESPWFLQVSYFAPHEPVEASTEFLEKYPNTEQGAYLALLEQLDASIGRILDSLESSGAADETIVVIVSDNGGTEQRYPSNTPYFGIKATYTEGGVRTPLMIRWPDASHAGTSYDHPVSLMDLYPTLLSASGVERMDEDLDGQNLLRYIETNSTIQRPLYWESYGNDNYFFSVLDSSHRYRYSEGLLGRDVLMDLNQDEFGGPASVVEDAAVVNQLRSDYLQWRNDVHSLDTTFQAETERGLGVLTGDSLQRSPGHGGFTFGIGVQASANVTNSRQQIAYQDGLLDIHLSSGELTVTAQDTTLSAPFPMDGQCHSVILTAYYQARISWLLSNLEMQSPIQVMIDGQAVAEVVDRRELPKSADLTAPTYIGFTPLAGERNEFSGQLFEPVLFNHRVFANATGSQPSAASLAASLCL
ncbi:MAG: sulfatase-like hydrolase/transferase, partial [Pseudomonadales bacterium]|nr:sulfatase-like hydrolase/transferase [Pseudomonadales bacterium]